MTKLMTVSKAIALFTMCTSLTACSRYTSEKSLDTISVNMTKQEVIKKMDCPGLARGSVLNKYGQVIEVREYKTRNIFASTWERYEQIYWLYFCDGKLVQWGQAGDWAKEQKMIYDINFKTSSN